MLYTTDVTVIELRGLSVLSTQHHVNPGELN